MVRSGALGEVGRGTQGQGLAVHVKGHAASRLFNLIVRLTFGFPYKDTQCGAKAFSLRAVEVLLDNVTSLGYHFDCEVLWRLRQAGLRILEVPITWRDQGGSGIRLGRDGLKMLGGLFRIRFQGSSRKGS